MSVYEINYINQMSSKMKQVLLVLRVSEISVGSVDFPLCYGQDVTLIPNSNKMCKPSHSG